MQSNKNKHQKNRSRRKIVAQQTCPLCALWLACAIFFRFVWHYSALTDHKKKLAEKSIKCYTMRMNDDCDTSIAFRCCRVLVKRTTIMRTSIKYLSKMSHLKFIVCSFNREVSPHSKPAETKRRLIAISSRYSHNVLVAIVDPIAYYVRSHYDSSFERHGKLQ